MITYSKNGCWGIEGVDLTKLNDSKVYGALFKLHKYEKTGLEPEQIIEMDELYREKCEEVNKLKKPIEHSEGHMPTNNMNFGQALAMLKGGKKVARRGWNGKGMYLFLAHGKDIKACTGISEECVDVICMKTAQNTIVFGWLASQTDMLAEDWEVV